MITVDTLRADRVSAYFGPFDSLLATLLRLTGEEGVVARSLETVGYPAKHPTPYIDGLAADGVIFENAHCDVTWTTPSMASTLTGTYALRHGLRSNAHRLHESRLTITEILSSHGYQTGAVIGSYPLDSVYGLDQGFDVYDDTYTVPLIRRLEREHRAEDAMGDAPKSASLKMGVRTDEEVSSAAIRVAESFLQREAPFFLWVHYFGPHSVNYVDRDGLQNNRYHVATYSRKVARTDRAIGRLLAFLENNGLEDSTLVIVHADHGESLWEHGYVGHGRDLYENNLRVPLVMRWPSAIARATRLDTLVGNIDIAPTILEAAGIDPTQFTMDGRSVLEAVRTGAEVRDELYIETYMSAHKHFAMNVSPPGEPAVLVGSRRHGVLGRGWKYVVTDPYPLFDGPNPELAAELARRVHRSELYNLESDPAETRNVAGTSAEVVFRYTRRLSAFLAIEQREAMPDRLQSSAEHVRKLRALGYMD